VNWPSRRASARQLLDVHQEPRLETREDLKPLREKEVEGAFDALRAHPRCQLDGVGQVELVGALVGDGDADALAVDVGGRANRGASGNEVGDRDLQVGGGEGDLAGALGLDPEERDVPGAGLDCIGQLAGGIERDELDGRALGPDQEPGHGARSPAHTR
jgi:hypothetical protein